MTFNEPAGTRVTFTLDHSLVGTVTSYDRDRNVLITGDDGYSHVVPSMYVNKATPVPSELYIHCETCDSEVRDNHSVCLCWAAVASSLERHLGYDCDHAADVARKLWNDLTGREKASVWNGDYTDEGIAGNGNIWIDGG